MEKLCTVSTNKTGSWPEAQIMNSLSPNSDLNWRKQGKPLDHSRYDLNQIPYDYTGEVTNRFKKLDTVDRVPEEERDQNHPNEKEMQEGKVVVKQALQIARRDMKAFLNAKK